MTSVVLSRVLPLRVFPLFLFPALSLLPGHTPAHDARWAAVGNLDMSVPMTERIVFAELSPTPGISMRSSTSSCWSDERLSSMMASISSILLFRYTMCSRHMLIIFLWTGVRIPLRSSASSSGVALRRDEMSPSAIIRLMSSAFIASPSMTHERRYCPDLFMTEDMVPEIFILPPSSIFCILFCSLAASAARLLRYVRSSLSSL